MPSIEAQNPTAVIEGCGNQPISGYAYCRKREGSPTTQNIVFIVPPVDCNSPESCVSIKLFRNNSDLVIGLNIPKGQTRAEVSWKSIVGRDHFALGDRGFWPFLYQIKYKDNKGLDRSLVTEGEIRLRVYAKDYLPLHESLDDPAFYWEFIENGTKIKITTSGRTYVAPVNTKSKTDVSVKQGVK